MLERRPDWGGIAPTHTLLRLDALDTTQSQALAASLLSRVQGSAALQQRLVTLSDGNPLFMEELVRMCLDQGVIVQDTISAQGAWQVLPERLGRTRMPTTLVGVLQARLRRPAAQRSALQQASIVGHVFWDQVLAALDPAAPAALAALQARLLVQQRSSSSFEDTPEEAFRHGLLHQVTYDTVLRSVRTAGHGAAADWLAQRMGDRPAEFLAIAALHYERAARLPQAADFYERAAHDALGRAAFSTTHWNTPAMHCAACRPMSCAAATPCTACVRALPTRWASACCKRPRWRPAWRWPPSLATAHCWRAGPLCPGLAGVSPGRRTGHGAGHASRHAGHGSGRRGTAALAQGQLAPPWVTWTWRCNWRKARWPTRAMPWRPMTRWPRARNASSC